MNHPHQDPSNKQQEHNTSISHLSKNTQSSNEQVQPPTQDIPEDSHEGSGHNNDNNTVLADSDSKEVDHWVGHFLCKWVKNLKPPPGCHCHSNTVTVLSLPAPPPPMDPNTIRDNLYWNNNKNPVAATDQVHGRSLCR